jgi:alpha-galactosidase
MKLRSCLFALSLVISLRAEDVAVSSAILNLRDADTERARPAIDRSAQSTREGNRTSNAPLRVAGRDFAHGIGTQVDTRLGFTVNGATRFTAQAGVDDATAEGASVRFDVLADGQSVWRRDLKRGDAPVAVEVDLRGKKAVVLVTQDIGNADTQAFADWPDAKFVVEGTAPKSIWPEAAAEPREILTPKPPAAPRINGPSVFGVRPGNPFFFQIAATGERPMTFGADSLPAGLTLDPASGRITGTLAAAGPHVVTLRAKNGRGTAVKQLRVEVGEKISLTPPMGWNSWNCWGVSVDQEKVLASAKAMVDRGLLEHGWSYINIDDTWQGERTGPGHALLANEKFPDMKKLCDDLHAMGLRAGIYSTPWDTSYAGFAGGSSDDPDGKWSKDMVNANGRRRRHHGTTSFAEADAKQWAAWGMDYLKYDWNPKNSSPPETADQFHDIVGVMARALRASGRDMVYSYSNSFPFEWIGQNVDQLNAWRTTGDINDTWARLSNIWSTQEKWRPFAGPGHWNDPDMLVVGPVDVGSGKNVRPSRLTPNEQYTHISLWCLLSSPLLIGCPLEKADDFTLSLLTNDEVLALDQDELGAQAAQVIVDGRKQVYVKELADGSHAIGLFNLAQEPQQVSATWSQLKLSAPKRVHDLWRQKDVPVDARQITAIVPRHGVVLVRVWDK